MTMTALVAEWMPRSVVIKTVLISFHDMVCIFVTMVCAFMIQWAEDPFMTMPAPVAKWLPRSAVI